MFAIVEDKHQRVLLVDHPKRGWDFCGGHLTAAELVAQDLLGALKREVLEESGYSILDARLSYAVYVENSVPSMNKELGCHYPNKTLMLHYRCAVGEQVSLDLHDDIQGARFFTREEALKIVSPRNQAILLDL